MGTRRKRANAELGVKIPDYDTDQHAGLGEVTLPPAKQAEKSRVTVKHSLPAKLTDLYQEMPSEYQVKSKKDFEYVPQISVTRPSIDSRNSGNERF